MAPRDVCLEILRFTQDSIKNTFKEPYDYQRIDDAVDQIGNNQLSQAILMPLKVVETVEHKGVLWSLDNRRLWVLRKAGVPIVKVVLVPPNYNRRSEDFFSSLSDPRLERRYSSANYFPRVRGGVRSVRINRGKGISDGDSCPPIRMLHYPTAVAGAAEANKSTGISPALPPHHFRTATVRNDVPAEVNYEASSVCFDKESQPMAQRDVCPENLRFAQDSIRNRFKQPYDYQRIDVAVDQIGNNQLNPTVLMPLNVVEHKSVLWSLNNRRLWVLRKAGVPTVKVVLVAPNFNRRSEEFFSSLSDPLLKRQYSSANYFPRVRGGFRFVGINRSNDSGGGAPPPPIPLLLHHPTTVAVAAQANRTLPQSTSTPPPPPPRHLRDITVSSNVPPLVSPLRNVYRQTPKKIVPKLFNKNSGPGGKKGSDLWGKILNVVNRVMDKGFGFFRSITSRAFGLSNEKVVRLGKNSFIVLVFCLVLRQAYNLDKGDVDSKLESRETITVSKGVENILRAGNRGGSCENVESDQNINNMRVPGYLSITAVKAVVGMEKMVSHLLSKMFCFLRYVERNAVDLSKGVVVGSGRKTLDTCGVILSQCFSRLHFITGQVAVRLSRMGICVSVFCVEKFLDLLRFIEYQAFGLAGEKFVWSPGKVQDALSFYLNKIEFFGKVVWPPGKVQDALSFCLNKIKEFLHKDVRSPGKVQDALSFYLNKIIEFFHKVVCAPEKVQDALNFCLNKIKELVGDVFNFILNKIKEFLRL